MARSRKYEKLPIEDFGEHLLRTNDLDPIYVALHKLHIAPDGWDTPKVYRWMIAYWCLYHAGAACWLSRFHGKQFWGELMKAAVNEDPAPTGGRWPRGHERRHFRGAQGVAAVAELRDAYPRDPADMVYRLIARNGADRQSFATISERVREHRGFGPWIAFKVGDMLERVLAEPIDFTESEIFVFSTPREAALMLWRDRLQIPSAAQPRSEELVIREVVGHLAEYFRQKGFRAPPTNNRELGLQEIETILCKWKSHMNGAYPLWNDIDEIHLGLEEWAPHADSVAEFKAHMPRRM